MVTIRSTGPGFPLARAAILLYAITSGTFSPARVGSATSSAAATGNLGVIPRDYFGLTILKLADPAPAVPYGTTRSWDVTYPGMDWADSNPSQGLFNFAGLDGWLAVNAGRGIDLIYTMGRTPRWASSQPNTAGTYGPGQCAPPANMADWEAYVTAFAQHAAGRIKYWEIWNEPQNSQFYCGDIQTMATMAQHAYKIVKSIDPTAIVLSPAPVGPGGATWLTTFLKDGGASAVDAISFHGYGGAIAENILSDISAFRAAMTAGGVSQLPLWDTEASWGANGTAPSVTNPQDRAAFLAKFYLLHWSQGVTRFVWYGWDADAQWGQLWNSATGINPAGVAYAQTYNWMVGATLQKPCAKDGFGDWSCGFTRSGGYSAQAMWNSTASATLKVATQFTQYRDLAGVVHPIVNHTVPVGNSPILVETPH